MPRPEFGERLVLEGAVAALQYLRDLITMGNRESYTREQILVLIDLIGHDEEMFPAGTWEKVDAIGEGGS
jgi:hypothetical protein